MINPTHRPVVDTPSAAPLLSSAVLVILRSQIRLTASSRLFVSTLLRMVLRSATASTSRLTIL